MNSIALPLTERQLCDMWNVSPDTLKRFRDKGELGYTRVGKRVMYTQKHIQSFLDLSDVTLRRKASGRSR